MEFAKNNVICIDLVNKTHWNIVERRKGSLNILSIHNLPKNLLSCLIILLGNGGDLQPLSLDRRNGCVSALEFAG